MSFVDVREPHTNKLLFRYDPQRDIIEIQHRNVKTVVDLTQYGPGTTGGAVDGRAKSPPMVGGFNSRPGPSRQTDEESA